jgi:phage FluMu gp28-like protein
MKIYLIEGERPFKKFSELARTMGWNYQNARYNVNTNGKFQGVNVEFIDDNCITLRELIKSNAFQENDFNPDKDGTQIVTWSIGASGLYIVEAEVTNVINMVDVGTHSNGQGLSVDGGDTVIDEIITVYDYFGDDIELDKLTEKLILNYLEL